MKFRTKMTVCMIWLLALAYGVGGSLLIDVSFRNALAEEKASARQFCQMAVRTLAIVNDYNGISNCMEQLASDNSEWIGIQLSSGEDVIYRKGTAPPMEADTLRVAGRSLQLSCTIHSQLPDVELAAVFDLSAVYAQRDSQLTIYRWTFCGVILLGGMVSWLLCSWLTAPLRSLTRAAKLFGEGKMTRRIHVRSGDEVGALAAECNTMADRVQESLDGMKAAMERQEDFMGSFAHELKTPMTSIIGYADLLRSQSLSETDRRDAANYIFSEGKRLENLSLKLLELLVMDREDLPLRQCSPSTRIERLVREYRPIFAEEDITLTCRCQRGKCLLEPDLFGSLLYNLIDNSRKAMDHGGKILIRQEMTDTGCRIQIHDNGRGMPQEALNRVTEAFYRVDKSRSRAQGGAGLGLALCRKIVELHRGTIAFSSREGAGTCVTVTLSAGLEGKEDNNVQT